MTLDRTHRRPWSGLLSVVVLAVALVLTGCDSNDNDDDMDEEMEPQTIAELASNQDNLSTLADALSEDLAETLGNEDETFTVFAPVNSAFANIDADELTSNEELLTEVLTYHVVSGQALTSDDIEDGASVETVEGGSLTFSVSDGTVQVNNATVTSADIEGSNGVVHLIDGVMLEGVDAVDRAVLTPQLSTLASAVNAAGLAADDSPLRGDEPLTVFAPVDAGFEGLDLDALTNSSDILNRVLPYHVISGQRITSDQISSGESPATLEGGTINIGTDDGVTVNGIPVNTTDIQTENAVIHLIDAPMLQRLDIVQRASVTEALSTVADAVETAGLAGSDSPLRDDNNPVTVFAPLNPAFESIDADELTSNTDLLTEVLTYHVVDGAVTSDQLSSGSVETLEGGSVDVQVGDDGVTVDGVPVSTTDVQVRNGVVHLIDGLLLQGIDAVDRAVLTPQLSTLASAIDAAGLAASDSPLRGDGPLTIFAPVDAGFEGLNLDALTGNTDLLTRILQYHVISGQRITSDQISSGESPATLEGGTITIGTDDGVTVNGIPVNTTDVQTENAVIHLIDGVLLRRINAVERASITTAFSTLTDLVGQAGLADALSGPGPDGEDGITVFAPTNDAFLDALDTNDNGEIDDGEVPSDSELESLLQYHVVDDVYFAGDVPTMETPLETLEGSDVTVIRDGSSVTLNPSNEAASVAAPDVDVTNGVIHGIDTVLSIPSSN
jgi:transforming growth factor-beta-induced protein